jgi:plasmid stabilization system protein ParE
MPRFKRPTSNELEQAQVDFGNTDPSKLNLARKAERKLESAFLAGITTLDAIVKNYESNPSAAVSAWKAMADVLQGRKMLEKRRGDKAKVRRSKRETSQEEKAALARVIGSYSKADIEAAVAAAEADVVVAGESEVDLTKLDEL